MRLINGFLAAVACVSALPTFPPNMTWALLAWSEGKDSTTNAQMVDIDLFDQASMIPAFKQQGKVIICYYSAGTAESWRPDVTANHSTWEAIAVGKISGWDELWLDITKFDALTALMKNRLDLAKARGCDGVEPDNTDCAFNPTDCWRKIVPAVTQAQATAAQLKYNQWTATYSHSIGLAVGLKNTGDIIGQLHANYDFSIAEECVRYKECDVYHPFHGDGKAIFGIDYQVLTAAQCAYAKTNFVQMKYCTGKNGQMCQSGTAISNCP
jgi:hypothetical protein